MCTWTRCSVDISLRPLNRGFDTLISFGTDAISVTVEVRMSIII